MKKDEVIKTLIDFNKHNDSDTSREVYEAINSAIDILLRFGSYPSHHIDKETLTVAEIIGAVNSAYKGDIMATVSGERPSREEHQYRMIAYYFLSLIRVSQKDMANLFDRTAGSVSLALKRFEDEMLYPDVRAKYERVLSRLNGNT